MSTDSNLEKEADQLERDAKVESSKGKYQSAIEMLEKAKTINQELGFQGKVNMIEKKIHRTKRLIAYETPMSSEYTPTFQQIEKKEISIDSPSISKNQQIPKKPIISPADIEKRKEGERISKAEAALDKGNKCIKEHEFENAKKCYEESIQIFKDLGWERQVQILQKERDNIDLYEETFKEKSEKKKFDNKRSYPLEKTKSQIPEKRTIPGKKNQSPDLTWAEKRRQEIRERVDITIAKAEQRNRSGEKIINRENIIQPKKHKRLELQKKIQEKKDQKEKLLKDAEIFLDQAKGKIKKHQYDEAKEFYRQAIKKFKDLGWFNEVNKLYAEIKNLEKYKLDDLKKQKRSILQKEKEDEMFQKRIEELKRKKEEREQIKYKRMESLSEENKTNLKKANLLHKKAEKEENMGKIGRAIGRYEIILELYESMPSEKIDLSQDIKEIKTKLSDLKSKI